MIEAGTISAADLDLMLVTDSVADAMAHIDLHAVEQFGLTRSRGRSVDPARREPRRRATPAAPTSAAPVRAETRPNTSAMVAAEAGRPARSDACAPGRGTVHACASGVMYA